MRMCVFLTHWPTDQSGNIRVCPAQKETGRMFYQNCVELSGWCLSGYQGRRQSLARIEINDWRGDGGIMPPRGRLFTPPPHFREDNYWAAQRYLFGISHHLVPHWVMETLGPMGGGAGVVRAVKLPPSLPPLPPTHQPHPHSHRRSICPGQRLDTSPETASRQPRPKYADCNNRKAVPIQLNFADMSLFL